MSNLAADGVSATFRLRRNNTATVALSVTAAQSFIGTARVQKSRNGEAWETARDKDGVLLEYTGTLADPLVDAIVTAAIKNEEREVLLYRVQAIDMDVTSDPLQYAITEAADDVVETVLSDGKNRRLIGVREDGSLEFFTAINNPQGGTLEGSMSGTLDEDILQTADVTISAADIIATGAGKFGHAAGYPLVADPGADKAVELISAVMVSDRAVAAYTDGGNITVNENGGAALTGLVSAANSLGAATDKVAIFTPLAAAARVVTVNKGLNLVSSAAFTNPGTAAGVVRVRVNYRVHTLGLS